MNIAPSAATVRRSLSSHSVIGLTVGVMMYLICLTGTLAVFAESFERWEQPEIPEFKQYNSETINNAIQGFLTQVAKTPESIYVVFPTKDLPRMHVSGDEQEWYLHPDGSLSDKPVHGWTAMLKDLHVSLLLPHTIGTIIVSCFGAMLLALIISGLCAHPRIFRDAFRFRLGGSKRLEQADIHNRLSVWGLPFHLMIAITGAFFGLVGLLVFVVAAAFYDGDREAVIAKVYGDDPVIDAPLQPLNAAGALSALAKQVPTATPIFMIAQKMGTRQQYLEVAATLPGRLTYSEMYRFNANGEFINHQGLSDGPIERQIAYSVYRLHFGWFGGLFVKAGYLLMGLALTVICVSGINIWLQRNPQMRWVNHVWCGAVWGTPLALCVSAFFSIVLAVPAIVSLALALIGSQVLCLVVKDEHQSSMYLKAALSLGLCCLVFGHYLLYSQYALQDGSFWVNSALLVLTAAMIGLALRDRHRVYPPSTAAQMTV